MIQHDDYFEIVSAALRHAASHPLPSEIGRDDGLIDDLGFDSMSISVLALHLEKGLGRPVLLSRWVEQTSDPSQMTVGSLCDYLRSLQ